MNFYYTIINFIDDELWFIMKSPTTEHVLEETRAIDKACGCGYGTRNYMIDEITQAEFETYQAFGIKEIKL